MTDKPLENMGEGRQIIRGEDGRIKKMVLTSEAARAMAQAGAPGKVRDTTSSQLLAEAGLNDTNQAPEHLRLLAHLARSGRSGSVAALRDFKRLTQVGASVPTAMADGMYKLALIGDGSNFVIFRGSPYRKTSGRGISELVRMIRDTEVEARSG